MALNVPAGHCSQGPSSGPVDPSGHGTALGIDVCSLSVVALSLSFMVVVVLVFSPESSLVDGDGDGVLLAVTLGGGGGGGLNASFPFGHEQLSPDGISTPHTASLPSSSTHRRIDSLYTPKDEYPFALLYFTGSKIFNTVMRARALSMNYSLNEHGIYKMDGKKKGDKVQHHFATEKDIFQFLHMEYKEPHQRINGRSVSSTPALSPQKKTKNFKE